MQIKIICISANRLKVVFDVVIVVGKFQHDLIQPYSHPQYGKSILTSTMIFR